MFGNYIKVALRALKKNKLYALINILGLATGMAIYVFATVLVDYETTHDTMWDNSDNIYTVGVVFNPEANVGILESDGTQSALGPILKVELKEIEHVARTIRREFLVSVEADNYYQNIRFVDPEILQIFNFDYLYGNSTALDNSSSVLLSESMATKLFGEGANPIGKVISLDHEHDLTVSAVIKDVPVNTHFGSLIIQSLPVDIFLPMNSMERITEFKPDEDWGNLSLGNMTYVVLPEHLDGEWLKAQLDGIHERLVPEERAEIMTEFTVNKLQDSNVFLWRAMGASFMMTLIKVLGLMVLLVACINYTNLATAQSMGRTREVGLRKTMGANRKQLMGQFLTESLTIAAMAMVVAIILVEIAIPLFNSATGKVMLLDYITFMPWIILSTLLVGLLSGAYPAYLITKTHPIDALNNSNNKGAKGNFFRSLMIATQFFISVTLLAIVAVGAFQIKHIEEASNIYPKEKIYTLSRVNVESIEARHDTLRNELLALPGVESVSYSSQVPFEQSNSSMTASADRGNEAAGFSINQMRADHDFLKTYDVPLLAGRHLDRNIANDSYVKEVNVVNVLINELAVEKFGFSSNQDALGKNFYDVEEGEETTVYTIVGIIENQNILGAMNSIKPWVFFVWSEAYRRASIRLTGDDMTATVEDIEGVWNKIVPDYPMQGAYLLKDFEMVFNIFQMILIALGSFAVLALMLGLIGLFGLAAYMAAQRTREIGIRKVLGANSFQIARLLVVKFSKPVIIASPFALVSAFLASQGLLTFFADRIADPYIIVLGSGIVAIIFACATVASHAIKVARQSPIKALRYE